MTTVNTVNRRQTIVGLHYLRAAATISVVLVHACGITSGANYFGAHPANGFFEFGAGEIDLFFMMSGFIMVVSTYSSQTGLPRMSVLEFFRRRAVRILPMLWLAVISYAMLRYAGRGGAGDLWTYARSLILWPIGEVSPWVIWTIRYEVLFYLVFGLCFILYRRWSVAAVLWFVSPLLLFVFAGGADPDIGEFGRFLISPYNLEFGIGVALGFGYRRLGAPVTFRFQLPLLLGIFALIRVLVWWTDVKTGTTLFVMATAPLCLAASILAIKTDPVGVFKPGIFLGDASYAIFLFHPHFLSAILGGLAAFTPWMPPMLAALIGVAASVGLASLVHVFIEKPIVEHSTVMFHTILRLDRSSARS